MEGLTARMVVLSGDEGDSGAMSNSFSTSGSISNSFSVQKEDSGVAADNAVLSCEKRLDLGEKEEGVTVDASDALVWVECLAFLTFNGLGSRALVSRWLASIFATVSETRDPLRSNVYPGTLRGGSI